MNEFAFWIVVWAGGEVLLALVLVVIASMYHRRAQAADAEAEPLSAMGFRCVGEPAMLTTESSLQ